MQGELWGATAVGIEQSEQPHNRLRLGDARRATAARRQHELVCQVCGDGFTSTRASARACSDRCRARIRYWMAQGAVRMKVRLRMLADQMAEIERIARIVGSPR